jgi:mono/diheme cytochrome c family protein
VKIKRDNRINAVLRIRLGWATPWLLALSISPALAADSPSATETRSGTLLEDMLAGPMAHVDHIVFAVRESVRHHYYENFGHSVIPRSQFPLPDRGPAEPGTPLFGRTGRLCRLDLRTGELTVLLDDPAGGVRDPQVHYSGQKILFSYRRGSQPYYHLFEIGVDGSGLVQRTDGPFDDIEPTYLPDGGIMFCSSRCRRVVGCFPAPVATLYRSDAAGRDIRPISANPFTDNTPWMLADGRVLYTRWEYVDRNQMTFHHLWTANPDGTAQMVFFGNQYPGPGVPPPRFFGVAMLDAKPIPGSGKVVASFSPNHGQWEHMGLVTVIDPSLGPDARQRARTINAKRQYRDPWAFSEDCFLVADEQGIWVMDGQGNTELVYHLPDADAGLACHEPRPIVRRPSEPLLPSRVDRTQKTGQLFLEDVYVGRNMSGVRRGEIKKLLVLEQLPKPVDFSGGPEPLTIGGTFNLERILGTVPVEPDGSAYFEAPAGRPLFFVALDARDLSVKRMQSFVTVQPGERIGCVGCHEPRRVAPPAQPGLLATARPPSHIQPEHDVPDVFDYPRDIQPVLDQHCVACHNPDRREGGVDLCGDHTPLVTVSYWTMLTHGLISDGRNFVGDQPPRALGSSASRLLKLGQGGHYDAQFTAHQSKMIRLWIESGATYPGTYAALGCGMSLVNFPEVAIQRRCAGCHRVSDVEPYAGMSQGDLYRFGSLEPPQALVSGFSDYNLVIRLAYLKFHEAPPHQSLCNLSRPEKSLLLQAPLARVAGGLGLCGTSVFRDKSDPDYQTMLGAIRAAGDQLARQKRFDMPGFRPSPYYVRQMQHYGALPDPMPDSTIDPYATDRAYWELSQCR